MLDKYINTLYTYLFFKKGNIKKLIKKFKILSIILYKKLNKIINKIFGKIIILF